MLNYTEIITERSEIYAVKELFHESIKNWDPELSNQIYNRLKLQNIHPRDYEAAQEKYEEIEILDTFIDDLTEVFSKPQEFLNKIKGGSIPREFIPAVEKGAKEAMEKGVVAGYPMVDISVILYDGSFHEVDSSEMAFKICASMAIRDGAKQASPVILEPIMKVVATTPEDYLGDIIGDLNKRRGKILGQDMQKKVLVITAEVPLSEMFGYSTQLRSLSSGRATYTMEPSHFEKVPAKIQEQIMKK